MTKHELFTYYAGYTIISGFRANEVWNFQRIRFGILSRWRKKYPGQDDPEERFLEL